MGYADGVAGALRIFQFLMGGGGGPLARALSLSPLSHFPLCLFFLSVGLCLFAVSVFASAPASAPLSLSLAVSFRLPFSLSLSLPLHVYLSPVHSFSLSLSLSPPPPPPPPPRPLTAWRLVAGSWFGGQRCPQRARRR